MIESNTVISTQPRRLSESNVSEATVSEPRACLNCIGVRNSVECCGCRVDPLVIGGVTCGLLCCAGVTTCAALGTSEGTATSFLYGAVVGALSGSVSYLGASTVRRHCTASRSQNSNLTDVSSLSSDFSNYADSHPPSYQEAMVLMSTEPPPSYDEAIEITRTTIPK